MTSERAVSPSGAAAPSRLDPYTFALFRRLSAWRGVRLFHPRGVAHRAVFRSSPNGLGAAVLAEGFEHEALVRLSRGVGFRPPLPDVLGLAIRLPDVYGRGSHQDFLLASSGSGPLGRRMLRPTRRSPAELYSSLLPYDVAGRRVLVGARPIASRPTAVFELLVASSTGPWHAVGQLSFAERLDDSVARALRFDPWHSGGNIVPAGLANRLRAPAYRGSRRGSAK